MHFWSKFGKPHFIWNWLIARTNSQAKNGVNVDFQVQFDLEDHRQSTHKTIGILIKVFYISDPNLVILAWTVNELSHGQAHDWRTDTYTHTQATTIPKGQYWPRVKNSSTSMTRSTHLPYNYHYLKFLFFNYSNQNACVLRIPPLPHDYLYYQSYWIPFIPSLQLYHARSMIKNP